MQHIVGRIHLATRIAANLWRAAALLRWEREEVVVVAVEEEGGSLTDLTQKRSWLDMNAANQASSLRVVEPLATSPLYRLDHSYRVTLTPMLAPGSRTPLAGETPYRLMSVVITFQATLCDPVVLER